MNFLKSPVFCYFNILYWTRLLSVVECWLNGVPTEQASFCQNTIDRIASIVIVIAVVIAIVIVIVVVIAIVIVINRVTRICYLISIYFNH